MSPKRKTEFTVDVHPAYLAELRQRIEDGPGMVAVAAAAGMNRVTLWRLLNEGADQRGTVDAAEKVRRALEALVPDASPMPPPVVSVQGALHHAWIELGETMLADDPAAVTRLVESPSLIRAAARKPRVKPRKRS